MTAKPSSNELALGVVRTARGTNVEMFAPESTEPRVVGVQALALGGIPVTGGSRVRFQGELGIWKERAFEEYAGGFGMSLPQGREARHQVFAVTLPSGEEVLAPALVFMRSFFWPCEQVLPATFTSLSIDSFAFVRFDGEVPVVNLMEGVKNFRSFDAAAGNDRYLTWLHSSRSARLCSRSPERSAMRGWLGLQFPLGEFDLVFSGPMVGKTLYATSAELVSVVVPADDAISGQAEVHFLHRAPRSPASRRVERMDVNLSEDESSLAKRVLLGSGYAVDAELLQLMLKRLKQGYWNRAEPGRALAAGKLLRELETRGAMDVVLDQLLAVRGGIFSKKAPARDVESLRAKGLPAGLPDTGSAPRKDVAKVFLDTEFVDEPKSLLLLSIAMVGEAEQFYGERDLVASPLPHKAGRFIQNEVLPQLDQGVGIKGSVFDVARGMAAWLNDLGADRIEVHYDFSADYTLLEGLLALVPGKLRVTVEAVHIGYLLEDASGEEAAQRCWQEVEASRGLRRHHALADAMALEARFGAVHGGS